MTWKKKEDYFNTHKHLPDVPDGCSIQENGIKITETLSGITKNTEENSLDIIELFKRLEKLELENKLLKDKINTLENK